MPLSSGPPPEHRARDVLNVLHLADPLSVLMLLDPLQVLLDTIHDLSELILCSFDLLVDDVLLLQELRFSFHHLDQALTASRQDCHRHCWVSIDSDSGHDI
jgi:hypothetical protein